METRGGKLRGIAREWYVQHRYAVTRSDATVSVIRLHMKYWAADPHLVHCIPPTKRDFAHAGPRAVAFAQVLAAIQYAENARPDPD